MNRLDDNLREAKQVDSLIDAFEQAFFPRYNTRLVRGDDEPVYLPANDVCAFHKIVFAHGFFASALHELAHWCIAGKARRLQEDYGYWYCPDGRDEQAQRMFEKVEVKPQALEKAFSIACQRAFQVSTDNLHGAEPDRAAFTQAVDRQYYHYCEKGFPARAAQLINVLAQTFGGEDAAAQGQKQVA